MASGALRQAVFSAQGIFRVLVVIENNRFPLAVGVAALAFGAEIAFVFVVFLVTGDASCRRTFEFGISVAVLADDIPVFSGEREFRFAVVEKRFLPVAFLVTVGAQGAQAAFVLVVLLVAGKAVRRRITELDLRLVAIAARNFCDRMPAFQHEVRELVVE